ncbi:MAG: Endopolyphosphatase [Cirrosporium novae-zelandiae]|nr:MAG: Endopolyphosphatase [Cirrosporium novae-zelandiae]
MYTLFLSFLYLLPTLLDAAPTRQIPLQLSPENKHKAEKRPLHGRFLHITDIHPDKYYKPNTSPDDACHRGKGPAGYYGAEITNCDTPFSLVDATFDWIDKNLKDSIDFVIWTGDSARHDKDEKIPRTKKEVVQLNQALVDKFVEVFGKDENINDTDPTNDFIIPIIPTIGNNDVLPHNIFTEGPNEWTTEYSYVWEKFIPEEQRHAFQRGGWFYVEVIPNKLAVFSLNTMYFFDSNSAVDGCMKKSEPGHEHMEWLRIQLQFLRERGMKAILMGHVPPARTDSKQGWDETCWQMYILWLKQYRDVIVGSLYGHMNLDHFMLQDFDKINIPKSTEVSEISARAELGVELGDEISIASSVDYLSELRSLWEKLPDPPSGKSYQGFIEEFFQNTKKDKKGKKDKKKKFFKKIGGKWGERYSVGLVSPSVVPNYYPTLRVIEYNITGLEGLSSTPAFSVFDNEEQDGHLVASELEIPGATNITIPEEERGPSKDEDQVSKKPKKPTFTVPSPPSKGSPPGPAYSPQVFTWLSYTQYFANLTYIQGLTSSSKSHKSKPSRKFSYEVEYNTSNDSTYKMHDLTVRSYIDLARRIGKKKPDKGDRLKDNPLDSDDISVDTLNDFEMDDTSYEEAIGDERHKVGDRKAEHHKTIPREVNDKIVIPDQPIQKKKFNRIHGGKVHNKVWLEFVKRAYVSTRGEEELHELFGDPR